jgi:hypothetical protein
MEKKEFSVLYLTRLKLDDLFALFKSTPAPERILSRDIWNYSFDKTR